MRVDWSKAKVSTNRDGEYAVEVHVEGIRGSAYHDRLAHEIKALGSTDHRTIAQTGSGSSMGARGQWVSLRIWPIDPDDIDGERRFVEEMIARVERAAEPEQTRLDADYQRQQQERESAEARAKDLTEKFREGT